MCNAARVGHRLWAAAFVFRAGDTILRPNFHCYADDVVTLFAQQISSDAGIHSTAHAQENALLVVHNASDKLNVENRSSNRCLGMPATALAGDLRMGFRPM